MIPVFVPDVMATVSIPISTYLVEECGYPQEEADAEEYALLLEMDGLMDETYMGPTEEEQRETFLSMCNSLAA